jgi:hypothetical protein
MWQRVLAAAELISAENVLVTEYRASLGLLMTDAVQLGNVEVFAEPHKGTLASAPFPCASSPGCPPYYL